jgi:hypothetical protein
VRIHRIGLVAGVLLAAQLAGTGCILIPKIEKRDVRMVVSQVATVPLHALGTGTTYSGSASVNLRDSVDIGAALASAGIDVSDVDSVVIGKVEYRIVAADANAARAITGGTLQVSAGGGSLTNLIVGFAHSAGAVTPWTRADLTPAGVNVLNQMLQAILTDLQGGATADEHIGYVVSGNSSPSGTTDFWYEVRLTIMVAGNIQTDVLN